MTPVPTATQCGAATSAASGRAGRAASKVPCQCGAAASATRGRAGRAVSTDPPSQMRPKRPHHTGQRSRLLLAITALAMVAFSAIALDVPPPPTREFTDTAKLVSSADAEALTQKLRAFSERSGAQFIIYTFPSLEGQSVEDFTIRCAERWKAGQKKYDNGLILFVFAKERKVRIEVGYGLEGTITDAVSSDVIRNDIAPHFQSGDYAGGLNAAADDLIARVEKKEVPVPVAGNRSGARAQVGRIDPFFLIVIVVIFFLFILPMLRRGGLGGCGGCGGCWPFFLPWGGSGITFGGGGSGWGSGGGFGGSFGGGGGWSGGGGGFGGGGATGGW
jgi:uncharacterized protein